MKKDDSRKQKAQRDMMLMVPLIILNLVSGFTTISGAEIALGDIGVAIIAGITIQGILFILLSGSAAKHAPVRKWIAVFIFSFFSIYTSFFTYHSSFLSEDTMAGANLIQAEQSHMQLVTSVANPFLEKYETLSSEYGASVERLKREQDGGGGTGIVGFGPEARKVESESLELKTQLSAIEGAAAQVKAGKADFDTMEPRDPESILKIDQAIWTALPSEYQQNGLNGYGGFDRNDYFNQDDRFALLTPILTLTSEDNSATKASSIAALVIASALDGVSILLGTAIEIRAKRVPFEGIALSFSQMIWGFKQAIETVFYYLKKPGTRHPIPSGSEMFMARDAVYLIELKLKNRGSNFLTVFFNAVDPVTKKIDFADLRTQPEPTMQIGYRLLMEAFRHPSLNWVKTSQNGKEWMFVNLDSYVDFCKWISDEIVHQAEVEEAVNKNEWHSSSPKVVKIRRPLVA